ncbi:MAG: NAD(P)/FAD-dependent oxidoreductase, partial [Gemmatimonadota bacterium]
MPGEHLHVVVIGAGAFGGWTALHLREAGHRVTLVDAWGPGNSRASSGGETRVIRCLYGGRQEYTRLTRRAFDLWAEHEARAGERLLVRTGALWLFEGDDGYARASLPHLEAEGLPIRELSPADVARAFPQVSIEGVRTAFFEPHAGYLHARRACHLVRDAFVKLAGEWHLGYVVPGRIAGDSMAAVRLADGSTLAGDVFVFACGAWLGRLFPDVIGDLIRPTRQEKFYFGTPPGDPRFDEPAMPVWLDFAADGHMVYGTPGNAYRGFKAADDARGGPIDPTTDDRIPSPEALAFVRSRLAHRFPALASAPVVETRVCQYEQTPDGN